MGDSEQRRPAVALPRKLSESWFSVFEGGRHVGYDWIYWEPHADKTAWLARESRISAGEHDVQRKVEARFRLEALPVLTWCRSRDGEESAEYALPEAMRPSPGREQPRTLRAEDGLLPRALVAVIASAARDTAGEACALAVLDEGSGEAALAQKLICDGREEVESPDVGKLPASKFRLVGGTGETIETYWVDGNRRLRRIEAGGLVAVLTSKTAAQTKPG